MQVSYPHMRKHPYIRCFLAECTMLVRVTRCKRELCIRVGIIPLLA